MVEINQNINFKNKSELNNLTISQGNFSIRNIVLQKTELPVATAEMVNMIVQYIGNSLDYEQGSFYKCVRDPITRQYTWEKLGATNTPIEGVQTLPDNPDILKFYKLLRSYGEYERGHIYNASYGSSGAIEWVDLTKIDDLHIIDINKLDTYLYRVTYDSLAGYVEDKYDTLGGGCSSWIMDGKMYRSYDYKYDDTPTFWVDTPNITGMAYISSLKVGGFSTEVLNQLPFHIVDGVNSYGIMVSTHLIYNDFNYTGGSVGQVIPMTKIAYEILNTCKSIEDLNYSMFQTMKLPEVMRESGNIAQWMVSDGTTTKVVHPDSSNTNTYVISDITSMEVPKITNFNYFTDNMIVSLVDPGIQNRPNGLERYNKIIAGYKDLSGLKFTKCYEDTSMLSEFIGMGGTTKSSSTSQLVAQYDIAKAEFDRRQRDGKTYQSVHSVIYGNKTLLSLYIQEDYNSNYSKNIKRELIIETNCEKSNDLVSPILSKEQIINACKDYVKGIKHIFKISEKETDTEILCPITSISNKDGSYSVVLSVAGGNIKGSDEMKCNTCKYTYSSTLDNVQKVVYPPFYYEFAEEYDYTTLDTDEKKLITAINELKDEIDKMKKKKLYQHLFGVKRSTSSDTVYITFSIFDTNATMSYQQMKEWLLSNGFYGMNRAYSASGLAASNTIYVASTSGGSTSTQATNTQMINGIYAKGNATSEAITLYYVYRAGVEVEIADNRLITLGHFKIYELDD